MEPIKTVSIAIVDSKGKILALKRSPHKTFCPGKWDIISGKLEKGETADQCFYRELFEEIGVDAPNNIEAREPYTYEENGRKWLVHPYRCTISADNPIKLNHEHTGFCWMTKKELLASNHATPLSIELAVWE